MEDFHILHEKENKLLKRKEIGVRYAYLETAPKREELRTKIAEKFGANPQSTVIVKIHNLFGHRVLKSTVHIYHTPEDAKKYDNKNTLIRNGLLAKAVKKEGAK